MSEHLDVAVPDTLAKAVRVQLVMSFRPPYEALIVVAVNGALMTGAWFLLPSPNPLFPLHGSLAFAMILASWMYSDVPATNVLGSDANRSIAALEEPVALRRLLYAKNLVLWLLVAPLCSLLALAIGISENRLLATVFTIVWIAVVPLGALGIAALIGIYFPYHPIALSERWAHRRPWRRMIFRWLILAVVPYGLVPMLIIVLSLPTLLLWYFSSQRNGVTRIPDAQFVWGVLVACAAAIAVWILGHRLAVRLASRRKGSLTAFLKDPFNG